MSAHFKKYFIGTLAVASVLGLIATNPFETTENPSHERLAVGLQSGYPPFEFIDAEGKIIGFDVDIAELLAKKLGKTLVIKELEFDGEILSLKQGKIDLIISGMHITSSRLKEIQMVPYHGKAATALSLIFWNEIPQGVHTLEDLAALINANISVESGAISEIYMQHHPEIPTRSFEGALTPLMDVKYGKSIANLVEADVAEYHKRQHPEIKIINVPLGAEDNISGFGIGIKKGNHELFQQIKETIHEIEASGELEQLENKWFKGAE